MSHLQRSLGIADVTTSLARGMTPGWKIRYAMILGHAMSVVGPHSQGSHHEEPALEEPALEEPALEEPVIKPFPQ